MMFFFTYFQKQDHARLKLNTVGTNLVPEGSNARLMDYFNLTSEKIKRLNVLLFGFSFTSGKHTIQRMLLIRKDFHPRKLFKVSALVMPYKCLNSPTLDNSTKINAIQLVANSNSSLFWSISRRS